MTTKKKTLEEVLHAFEQAGLLLISNEYKNALVPLASSHIACGHAREILYLTVSKAVKSNRFIVCKTCSTTKKVRNTEQVYKEILDKYGIELLDKYTKIKSIVTVKHPTCGHTYSVNLEKLLYSGTGKDCQVCLNSTRKRFFTALVNNNIQVNESEYITAHSKLNITYACGHSAVLIPNNTVCAGSGLVCRTCTPLPRDSSKPQRDIFNKIQKHYKGTVLLNDRKVLQGKELDIYIPEFKLGIEFHGTYWHLDKFLALDYHKNKADLAAAAGIKLIQIFETEWLIKQDIVMSRILQHIGLSYTIYARKCTVERIKSARNFLEDNHLQGAGTNALALYALKIYDEIVAVMTFGKPRYNSKYDYELLRFCSLTGVRVVGGASKLLKAFRSEYPGTIISYADRRYSNGALYEALGFQYLHTSPPNYKYHKYKTIYTRYQCQKHLLEKLVPEHYDKSLSELEIMRLAGFNKVYDAGNLVYIK